MILINASNISQGGSEQVTISIIQHLKEYEDITVLVSKNSKLLLRVLGDLQIPYTKVHYSSPEKPLKYIKYCLELFTIHSKLKYKCVLNVFGPTYFVWKRSKTISGFANAAVFKNKLNKQSTESRLVSLFKQLFIVAESKYYWVETKYAKDLLKRKLLVSKKNICTACNAPSSFFFEHSFNTKNISERPILFYPAVYREHKNHKFLEEFISKTDLQVELWVTLDEKIFKDLFKENSKVKNLGYLPNDKLPAYYEKADIIINASQLEIFSAVLVESHIALRPLVSVNKKYAIDIVSENGAYFFEENDILSFESALYSVIQNYNSIDGKLLSLSESTKNKYNPQERAYKIHKFINQKVL